MIVEPTQSEIATLAARLATGNEKTYLELEALTKRAISLWDAAGDEVNRGDREKRYRERSRERLDEQLEARLGSGWRITGDPIPLAKMLAALMPTRRHADRLRVFRAFVDEGWEREARLDWSAPQEPVDIVIGRYRIEGVDRKSFVQVADMFDFWHGIYSRRISSEAGRTAAATRAAKAAEKKAAAGEAGKKRER